MTDSLSRKGQGPGGELVALHVHTENLRTVRKCAMRDPAIRSESRNRIRTIRAALGLTREQCADAIGCSPRALASWELGEAAAPLDALIALERLATRRVPA